MIQPFLSGADTAIIAPTPTTGAPRRSDRADRRDDRVAVTIDWGPKRSYDMASDADRRVAYELVLQEAATTEQVSKYVNGHALAQVWRRLWLPRRVRAVWEERLPELRQAA